MGNNLKIYHHYFAFVYLLKYEYKKLGDFVLYYINTNHLHLTIHFGDRNLVTQDYLFLRMSVHKTRI